MKLSNFITKMEEAGDAYVYYKSPVSGKQKYHICTLDFTTKYISDKMAEKFANSKPNHVKAFCWDLNDFKNIDVAAVQSIVPLNQVINNN